MPKTSNTVDVNVQAVSRTVSGDIEYPPVELSDGKTLSGEAVRDVIRWYWSDEYTPLGQAGEDIAGSEGN